MTSGRIDTHTHVIPQTYRDWLEGLSFRGPAPDWDPAAALRWFEDHGIETGILSIANPGIKAPGSDLAPARAAARTVNEFCADVVRDEPRHFGFFASLVLPDVEGSIDEAVYALDELHADGVVLLSNAGGTYLGAPEWDPLLEILDERAAVIFEHPAFLPAQPVPGIPPGAIDFLADTTRAALNLVKHNCLIRFSELRIILAHGGGYVPYAAARIANMISPDVDQDDVIAQLQRFYFDTALIGGPYALPSLLELAEPDHITFGSDWPFEFRPDQSGWFTERLDRYAFTDAQRAALTRGNAERLFPRLARPAQATSPVR
jgi:predicted TIM-barrel fold metal-dependent hydrolase